MQITFFDPYAIDDHSPDGKHTITATTPEEYAIHLEVLRDLSRGIKLIEPPELPMTPKPEWFPVVVTTERRLAAIEAAIMDLAGEIYG